MEAQKRAAPRGYAPYICFWLIIINFTRKNAHGRKNLLSFLAILIREAKNIIYADVWRRNGDFYEYTFNVGRTKGIYGKIF